MTTAAMQTSGRSPIRRPLLETGDDATAVTIQSPLTGPDGREAGDLAIPGLVVRADYWVGLTSSARTQAPLPFAPAGSTLYTDTIFCLVSPFASKVMSPMAVL